eukprot:m.241121 g.241121  ORF g.241121 m.241121 type:complete len:607 (+) comp15317_c0_seq6:338-2158(+)
MPKKKAAVVEQRFELVHRSQRDPRAADEGSTPYVFAPVAPGNAQKKAQKKIARQQAKAAKTGAHTSSSDTATAIADPGTSAPDKRTQEMHDLGIFYDDGYDYSQHFRSMGTDPSAEVMFADEKKMRKFLDAKYMSQFGTTRPQGVSLPADMFASAVEEDVGLLNRQVPHSGPRLDWDPDVMGALDEAEDCAQLEEKGNIDSYDDFFGAVLGTQDAPDSDESDEDEDDEDLDEEEYMSRAMRNIGHAQAVSRVQDAYAGVSSDEDEDGWGEERDGLGAIGRWEAHSDTKSRFTEYSMTSSILPRSEKLVHHDEHFEELYSQYDNDQLGALDAEADSAEVTGHAPLSSITQMMDELMDDVTRDIVRIEDALAKEGEGEEVSMQYTRTALEKEEAEVRQAIEAATEAKKAAKAKARAEAGKSGDSDEDTVQGSDTSSDPGDGIKLSNDPVLDRMFTEKKQRQWDCESILSTRSTLYNHPTVIGERKSKRKQRKEAEAKAAAAAAEGEEGTVKIVINPKTGIPMEGLRGRAPQPTVASDSEDDSDDGEAVNKGVARDRHETKADKKKRKQMLKAERQQRRAEKKDLKNAFKSETKRQKQVNFNATQNPGV